METDEKKKVDCAGTARATHELSEYEMLEHDYDESTALAVTTKAFQRLDSSVTRADVKSAVKINRLARSGNVSVAEEREQMETKADNAAQDIINNIAKIPEKVD
jgi:hypothetical protein